MARKNLLKDLMETASGATDTPSPTPPVKRPRYAKGTIGAVSQSIAALKSRALAEIDAEDIDQGGLVDRLDASDGDHGMLVNSIREYGQQVPVLLRPHPDDDTRYQIVYGRRRVNALRDLKLPVKAMIRDIDDRDLIIAQGQENSARKDLTFIEKANFARQMREEGYARKIICDALSVDKTQISRMLSVADAVPLPLIEVIGAAPSVGRNRWLALVAQLQATKTDTKAAIGRVEQSDAADSDARFEALINALSLPGPARTKAHLPERALRNAAGAEIGRLGRKEDKIVVTIPDPNAAGFDTWLIQNFGRIHDDWLKERDGNDPES